jgi:hypothetical protein
MKMNLIDIIKDKNLDLQIRIDAVEKLDENEIDEGELDEETQLFIVKNSSNQSLLGHFVNNSKFKYVHYCAIDKINDEDVLTDIAINNTCTYSDNIGFLATSSTLIPAYYNSEKAFSKIRDSSKLVVIVKRVRHVLFNVDHIKGFVNDDDTWRDIAINAYKEYHQIFALNQIESEKLFQKTLIECDPDKIINKANFFGDIRFQRRLENIDDKNNLKTIDLNSSNSSTRGRAVDRIDDEDILKYVALNDDSSYVRLRALIKIHDEDFLKDFALNGKGSRQYALENIHDEDFIKDLALNDDDIYVRRSAIESISDENFLKTVALNDESEIVRRSAIESISDENFLKTVALNDEDEDVRRSAIENVSDEDFLKTVALNDEDEDVRKSAVENVRDEDFLKGVALNDEDSNVRRKAIENIDDKDFLRNIALNDEDYMVCHDACLKCGDTSLFKMFSFSKYPKNSLTQAILDNIDDRNVVHLIHYAYNSHLDKILDSITDMDIFLDVLTDRWDNIHWSYDDIERYLDSIDDEDLFKRIFLGCKARKMQEKVLERIDDEEFFKDVYLNNEDSQIRSDAICNIYDEDFLKEIAYNSSDVGLISSTIVNIENEDILKEIFLRNDNWFIKCSAVSKIHDQEFLKSIIGPEDMERRNEYLERYREFPHMSFPLYHSFRQRAIENIDDVDFCIDYAFNDVDEEVRKKASEKIHDEKILKDLFFNEKCSYVRQAIAKNIADDDFFVDIIYGDFDETIKNDVFLQITGEEGHIAVAYNFMEYEFSKRAINHINNMSILRDIAERKPTCEKDEEIIEKARERIYELFFNSNAEVFFNI